MTASVFPRQIHVERTTDPAVLRWVPHHRLLNAAAPGRRNVPSSSPLGQFVTSAKITEITLRDGDVFIRSAGTHDWSTIAAEVQAALIEEFDELDRGTAHWLLEAVDGSAAAPSIIEIQQIVDRSAGHAMNSHGGTMVVTAVDHSSVRLRAGGACHGCGQSDSTVLALISPAIRAAHPGIDEIVLDAGPGSDPSTGSDASPSVLVVNPGGFRRPARRDRAVTSSP